MDDARVRLKQAIEKRCKTIFISAIAEAETRFGTLWGEGRWEEFRKAVLDRGNDQLRNLIADLYEALPEAKQPPEGPHGVIYDAPPVNQAGTTPESISPPPAGIFPPPA